MPATSADPLLACKDLHVAHEQGRGWILRGLDLELHPGELVHLRGDNGSGKSSLLRALAGLVAPPRGEVRACGEPVGPAATSGRRHVGLVPDVLVPSPWLDPAEYLELRARWRGGGGPDLRARVAEALATWELEPLARRPVGTLSLGETRRVVLAAALLDPPPVLLLDEPTNGLDRRFRLRALELLRAAAPGRALLVTTHVEHSELAGATRVLDLEGGQVREVGS